MQQNLTQEFRIPDFICKYRFATANIFKFMSSRYKILCITQNLLEFRFSIFIFDKPGIKEYFIWFWPSTLPAQNGYYLYLISHIHKTALS